MSSFIGNRIKEYYSRVDTGEFKSPTQRLMAVIKKMTDDLNRYKANPTVSQILVQKKIELINELIDICKTLERLEPLDVWRDINMRIADTCLTSDQSDVALIYLPLKNELPPYKSTKLAIIDMAGFNFENPYHYSLHGEVNQL